MLSVPCWEPRGRPPPDFRAILSVEIAILALTYLYHSIKPTPKIAKPRPVQAVGQEGGKEQNSGGVGEAQPAEEGEGAHEGCRVSPETRNPEPET